MQNIIQKLSLGLTILALPILSMAAVKETSSTTLVPKEAKSFIHKTKDISVAEANSSNFTGTYTGKRYQYNASHTEILRSYTYTMNVTQVGTQVTGVTNITADNGDFANIKLRGVVISNKLYFEEYEIIDQSKSDDMVWCFKVGELQLGKNKGNTVVYGPTNSYTSIYYMPCTGGYTVLEKANEVRTNNSSNKESNQLSTVENTSSVEVLVYPNPFVNSINTSYTLDKDAQVQIELFDINGKLIKTVVNASQTAGEHAVQIDGSTLSNGVYVVKVNIGGNVSSKQVIKSAAN